MPDPVSPGEQVIQEMREAAARPEIGTWGRVYGKEVAVWADHLEAVEAERNEAREALRECTRLTGVDLSEGFPTQPPLHEFAVEEVRRLRADYDESAPRDELREARDALIHFGQNWEARAERAEEALRDLWADVGEMGRHYTTREVEAKVLKALAHPEEPKE